MKVQANIFTVALLLGLALTFGLSSCKSAGETAKKDSSNGNQVENDNSSADKKDSMVGASLEGCWADSREEYEYNSGFKIYRPCDSKDFPPSRFRFRMELKSDGNCTWLWLAPNDAHQMKPGTWSYDPSNKTLTIKGSDGNLVMQNEVLEASKSILKLKKK